MPTAAEHARKAATDATAAARTAAAQTEQNLTTVLRDGAYATVGAGDTLLKSARTFAERLGVVGTDAPEQFRHLAEELPEKARHLAEELPERARHLAEEAPGVARELVKNRTQDVDWAALRSSVETEFDQLVARGRAVVEGIQHSQATEKAGEQTKVATSQAKAAATSVRTAAGATGKQARSAVEGLREAAEERSQAAASQVKAAQTSVGKATDANREAVAEAADKMGRATPLEDLKVIELRKMAKERGVPGRTGMNKAELIRALS